MNLPGIAFSNVSEFFAMGGHALYHIRFRATPLVIEPVFCLPRRLSRRPREA